MTVRSLANRRKASAGIQILAVDPDYGLAGKPLSAPQTWLRSRRCFERDRSLAGAAT